MSLTKPTPGECVDRQTILNLKASHALEQDKEPYYFVQESEDIQRYLERVWFPHVTKDVQDKFDNLVHLLDNINAQLWDLEDEMRRHIKVFGDNEGRACITFTAFKIANLNDARTDTVKQINALFKVYERNNDKIYKVLAQHEISRHT